MNNYKVIIIGFCLSFLSGCASLISGSTEPVKFSSLPSGAEFTIKDENNVTVHHGTTPATVTLERGDGYFDGQSYQVDFAMAHYLPKNQTVDSSVNNWYLGNLLFGGALGLLIVDPITGAMWDLPDAVDVSLTPDKK